VNRLLLSKGRDPVTGEQLVGHVNQLKAFVDVCHVYGIAVLVVVVYNHAGGGLDSCSLDYFDLPSVPDRHNNIYFSGAEWAGGKVFDFGKLQVRSFLLENAAMFLDEYHADGLRFDEVTVIDDNAGRGFCQDLTSTLRYRTPSAVLIAEYWNNERWRAVVPVPEGMGFDLGYADGLRDGIRSVLAQAGGGDAPVDLGPIRTGLQRPWGYPHAWQTYNCVENHDLVLDADDHRKPRIARLAGGGDARSWYARSRARVATALLLTAPGVPMVFMGQEFLEDKLWSDNPNRDDLLIWWAGVQGADRHMADFHAFVRDLIHLRRAHPALRSDPVDVFHTNDADRIVAFHRWVPDVGRDVVVVASLAESTFHDRSYALGLPSPGHYIEAFNSDWYDFRPNPCVVGNDGRVVADGPPLHGFAQSAQLTIPANSVLVLTSDAGDGERR
jgi:1,4-alpha-glucan branching enzyme